MHIDLNALTHSFKNVLSPNNNNNYNNNNNSYYYYYYYYYNVDNNNNNNNNFIEVSTDLAEYSRFTKWGDYQSNWIITNQIKCFEPIHLIVAKIKVMIIIIINNNLT